MHTSIYSCAANIKFLIMKHKFHADTACIKFLISNHKFNAGKCPHACPAAATDRLKFFFLKYIAQSLMNNITTISIYSIPSQTGDMELHFQVI
jgi:hypothetical protein